MSRCAALSVCVPAHGAADMAMTNELKSARDFLCRKFPDGGTVLCAVSGGLDSMCLLWFLCQQPEFQVTAAHFNHHLRGAEADRDEQFVREFCRREGIPFLAGEGDTRAAAQKEGLSLEAAARRLRYAFLQEAAETAGCDAILTAHHADDNAETMLLNLLRGTGTAGLAGIPPVRGKICRPFLEITREELADYAAAHSIPHVEDATNADPEAAARNALRSAVMPVLRQINPRFARHMTRTAAIVREESEALEAMARSLTDQAKELPDGVSIPCLMLTEVPDAVAQRAVLRLMAQAGGHRRDLTAAHVYEVLELARDRKKAEGSLSLPHGLTARKRRYTLELTRRAPRPESLPIAVGGSVVFGGVTVEVSPTPAAGGLPMALPAGASMTVTAWRPGDWVRLPESRGGRSFKRLCAERGISPQQRDQLPVLRVGAIHAADPLLGVHMDFMPCAGAQTVFVRFHKKTEEKHHEK